MEDPSCEFQQLSVEYRAPGDMTLWFNGRIPGGSRTPRVELEWSELFREAAGGVEGGGGWVGRRSLPDGRAAEVPAAAGNSDWLRCIPLLRLMMDASHIHLFVAANGDDANPGTEERPLL
jgi:hypothetical protein